jgi:hypothetical protein
MGVKIKSGEILPILIKKEKAEIFYYLCTYSPYKNILQFNIYKCYGSLITSLYDIVYTSDP